MKKSMLAVVLAFVMLGCGFGAGTVFAAAEEVGEVTKTETITLNGEEGISPQGSSIGLPSPISRWYYNTGEGLPQYPDYDTYNLQQVVKRGDIIYDANGAELKVGESSIYFGHLAIVEDVYYDTNKEVYYIRIIEALQTAEQEAAGDPGRVMRGVFEESRLTEFASQIYRVNNATSSQIETAVNFAIGQLGKPFESVLEDIGTMPSIDYNAPDWYCSELIRAAYNSAGIDLQIYQEYGYFVPDPGIAVTYPFVIPSLITKSSAVTKINYSAHQHSYNYYTFKDETSHNSHCQYCGNNIAHEHLWKPVAGQEYLQCTSCYAQKYSNGYISIINKIREERA